MKTNSAIFTCLFSICMLSSMQSQNFELTPKIPDYAGKANKLISKKVKSQNIQNDFLITNVLESKSKTVNTNNINYQLGKHLSTAYSDRFYKIKIDVFGNFIFGGSKGYGTNDGDAILYKYDSDGNFKWVNTPAESSGYDGIYGLETDVVGNIYITGQYYSSAFNSSLASNGGDDIFVAKYNPDGDLLWARSAGGVNYDYGSDVTVDDLGNVYVLGFFKGTSNWSGISKTSSPQGDMFIAKYDNNGNIKWVRTGNVGSNNYLYEISVDKSGNSYVSANFSDSLEFEGSPVVSSVGGTDIFIVKYDTDGNYSWIKTAGGSLDDGGNSVVVDNEGNLIVAGYFRDNAQFGYKNLTSHGTFDIFSAKYSADGNLLWVKQLGGTGSQTAWGVCTDEKNNCYLTGWFSGSGALDNTSIVSEGAEDAYIIKYDRNGNLIWVEPTATGISKQVGGDVSVRLNKIAVAGYYEREMNIQGSVFPNSGGEDAYMAVFEQLENVQTGKIVNPGLSLSISRIEAGQSIVFSGTQFSSLGKVDLTFSGPELINPVINFQINLTGNFQYTFTTSSLQKTGEYIVTATDKISGKTITRKFEVIKDPTTVVDNDLIIIEPNNSRIRYVGEPLRIAWTDKVKFGVIPFYDYKHSYKIEYKIDTETQSGSWQLFDNFFGSNFGYGNISMTALFTPPKAGRYTFKITDNFYPSRSVSTPDMTIGEYVNQDYKVDFKWDVNSKGMYSTPEGAAADGVARFYMVVSNRNNATNNIKSVKVSLSDGNNQNPKYLGKVKYCSTQNDLEFTDEANEANSITAENLNPNVDGKYWFWYVAPDDFSRNESDWDKGTRIVTATFEITLTNGTTITPITKEITIVRPPLMLVHGLNGDPTTWDNFKVGINHPNYSSDNRFKVKKAVHLLPNSNFNENSAILLGYDENSFIYMLESMRKLGYACNQVDYVCHSMGGAVLRNTYDHTYSSYNFIGDLNYKNGFVNKFISLNTPHDGSSFANLLNDLLVKPNFSTRKVINILKKKGFYETSPNEEITTVTGAVADLRYKGGVKFNETYVSSHLIGTTYSCYFPNPQYVLRIVAATIPQIDLSGLCYSLDEYFTNNGYESGFMENNDIIVSLKSQFSGYDIQSPPEYCTKYSEISHTSALKEGGSPILTKEIQNDINTLLNTDVTSKYFTPSIKATSEPSNGSSWIKAEKQNVVRNVNDKIKINYPTMNSEYNAGDTMNVKLEVDTIGLTGVTLFFQDQNFYDIPASSNVEYQLVVNPEYIDGQDIVVVARYDNSDSTYISYANLDIKVNPVGSIVDFRINPEVILIEKGKFVQPVIEAVFPNAIATIGRTDLISVSIEDSKIVSYNATYNQFEGLTKGKTSATLTYREKTKTAFFEVLENEIEEHNTDVDIVKSENNTQLFAKAYPNPFSENITVEFTLPKSGNTRLEVYNVYGIKVKEVDFGIQSEGFNRKTINMKDLATGIYIYRLTSGLSIQNGSVIKM